MIDKCPPVERKFTGEHLFYTLFREAISLLAVHCNAGFKFPGAESVLIEVIGIYLLDIRDASELSSHLRHTYSTS